MNNIKNMASVSAQAESHADEKKLTGHLSTLDIVCSVLAYNAPLTIIIGLLPVIIGLGNGLGAPLTFLAAGGLMLLFAVGFTTMARHVPNAGAFYAYITVGLGRPMGLGSAFVAMFAYAFMLIGSYLYAGVIFAPIDLSVIGLPKLEPWHWSILLAIVVGSLGHFRIELSAKVLSVALLLEILVTFIWEAAVFQQGGASGISLEFLTPSNIFSGSIGIAVLFGVGCYAGFEATAVFREEARDPNVTVPRATYLAIIIMTVIFASATTCLILALGPEETLKLAKGDPSNMGLHAVGMYLGNVGVQAVHTLMATSIFACVLAIHNILGRYIYSLSIDGVFPRALGKVHQSHNSPYRASAAVFAFTMLALMTAVFYSVDPYMGYAALCGFGGVALMFLQVFTSMAILSFFARKNYGVGLWKSKVAPGLSVIGLLCTTYLATTNLELLTGNVAVAHGLMICILLALAVGFIYAIRLKSSDPTVYHAIGRQQV